MPDKENAYLLPKGPREGKRLILQHSILRRGLGANYLAPIGSPTTILDVAGGTGVWGREVARSFPGALMETFDKDLFPLREAVKRLAAEIPSNCHFYGQETESSTGADALLSWPYPADQFDFTHARYLAPFVHRKNWLHILFEALRVTRPGGWIEMVEGPLPSCDAPSYREIADAIIALSRARFGYYNIGPFLADWLREASAVKVEEHCEVLGQGKTAFLQSDVAEDMQQGFTHIGPVLIQAGFISKERYDACMQTLHQDMLEAGIVLPIYVIFGQKPEI